MGMTPICRAAIRGDAEIVSILAPLVANPNAACDNGVTPIWSAAFKGNAAIVKVLAPLVANPNTAHAGFTPFVMAAPFGIAAIEGHLNVVKILAPFIDDLNASQSELRLSLIEMAIMKGHLEVIRYLYQFIDINEEHPIFYAICNRQPEPVKLLANLSKNLPTPLSNGGFTPIELAEELGADEIVAILKTVEKAHSGC